MRFNHVYHASWHNERLVLRQNTFLTPSSIIAKIISGNIGFQPRGCCTRFSWNICLLLTDGAIKLNVLQPKRRRTLWNRFPYFATKNVHHILFDLSLKGTSQMYRRNTGVMVLLQQPAITAGSLTPSSVSVFSSFLLCMCPNDKSLTAFDTNNFVATDSPKFEHQLA